MAAKKVKVLIKEPFKEPYVKMIDKGLKSYQTVVGGFIQSVEMPNLENVDIFVNDEGLLMGLPANFMLPEYGDCVKGTCFLVGINYRSGASIDITDEQIEKAKEYIAFYKVPKEVDMYTNFCEFEYLMTERYAEYRELHKNQNEEEM